jgi:aspartyl-tRNA(Asn)/glutamyl-tRNA(Gln) amidotransferase subunit A
MSADSGWEDDWRNPAFLTRAYEHGAPSPVDIAEGCLARIARHDAALHTFTVLRSPEAQGEAAQSATRYRETRPAGPLDGVPIAVKDMFDVAGMATCGNSFAFVQDSPAPHDAAVVHALRAAGAIILGKTTLYELGTGDPDEGPFPAARNPWDSTLATGGSSSGSAAAVAAGFCAAALGTDTGGSIRIPAALCGVAGFKPSAGLLSAEGIIPLSWTLDHVGVIAPTASAVVSFLHVLAPNLKAPRWPLRDIRIAVPALFVHETPDLSPDIVGNYGDSIALLRGMFSVTETSLAFLQHVPVIGEVIARAEAYTVHEPRLRARRGFGKALLGYLARGAAYDAADYIKAARGRAGIRDRMAQAMADFDILVLPTVSNTAGPADSRLSDAHKTRFTRPFNITGQPAVTVLSGVDRLGRPIGMQFVGRCGEDHLVLQVAGAFEARIQTDTLGRSLAVLNRYA